MALRVWLPLNGNLENKGLSTIVPSGTPTFLDNGKIGKCISLTPRVSFTGMPRMDNFTVLFWLKVDSCSVDWADSLSFTSIQADGSSAAPFRFEATKTSRACSFHNNTPYAITQGSRILITEAQKGEWHHCGVSYNGTNLYTYIDGVLTYTDTGLGGYINNYFYIGETNNMVGGMNDLRVYDECLSQKQIKEISKGLVAHYKLEGPGANPNLLKNTNVNSGDGNYWQTTTSVFDETARTITITTNQTRETVIGHKINGIKSNQTYTMSAYAKSNGKVTSMEFFCYNSSIQGIKSKTFTNLTTEFQKYTWTFTTASDIDYSTSSTIRVDNNGTKESGVDATLIVKDVMLEEGDKATSWIPNTADAAYTALGYNNIIARDVSGNGYNGTVSGTLSYNIDSPRYSGSTAFNGSSHITSAPGSMAWCNFDNLTISTWLNPTTSPSGWSGSVGIQQDGGYTAGKIFSISNYAGKFSVQTDSSANWVTTQSETLPLNTWSHCVAVLENGTNLKMYLNGNLIKTITLNWGTLTATAADTRLAIGVDLPGGDEYFTGSISDARVYATALTADDILTLYKTSGIIDNKGNIYAYEFKEE